MGSSDVRVQAAPGHGGPATSELVQAVWRREAGPTAMGDALDQLVSTSGLTRDLKSNWSLWRAWIAANGDVERNAATGVFVRPGRAGADPVLVVYVDTRGHVTDFTANREIYRARMSAAGYEFSDVVFRQTRRPAAPPAGPSAARAAGPQAAPGVAVAPERPLTPLTPAEEARAEGLLAGVSAALRPSVSKAMKACLMREKAQEAKEG